MNRVIVTGRHTGKTMFYLLSYAQQHGWKAEKTRGGHLRFSKPGRPLIHTGSTPSDWRSAKNALARLVRADHNASQQGDQRHAV